MINKVNNKTRIKLKFHFPVLSSVLCLQKKKWYGWITISWVFASVVKNYSKEFILSYLELEAEFNKGKINIENLIEQQVDIILLRKSSEIKENYKPTIAELKDELNKAVEIEHYEKAKEIYDQIKNLTEYSQ